MSGHRDGSAFAVSGVIARRFQARYHGDVAALLLIDSSHEDQARRLGYGAWYGIKRAARRQARIQGVRRLAATLGLVGGLDAASLAWETVPEYAAAAKAVSLSTRQRRTVVREMLLLARPPAGAAARSRGAPAGRAQRGQRQAPAVASLARLVAVAR